MNRFKNSGALLSAVIVSLIGTVSLPLTALADTYDGTLHLPSTQVLRDWKQYKAGPITQDDTFSGAPVFSPRGTNDFSISLPQIFFSSSFGDGTIDCGLPDQKPTINATDGSISLIGSIDEGESTVPDLCKPFRYAPGTNNSQNPPTAENTTFISGAAGKNGLGAVIQYHGIASLPALAELAASTVVESIPNDPNNVKVTVNSTLTNENYGVQFRRQGDVARVIPGRSPSIASYPDTEFYKDGNTYVIDWASNWVGQIPKCMGEDCGRMVWSGEVPSPSCDGEGACSMDRTKVNTGYPTPQVVQLVSTAPSKSESITRPRNSDILKVTDPACTTWSDGNFWRTVQHVHCFAYDISADGRTGRGDYYDSAASAGWLREALGYGLTFASLIMGGEFLMSLTNEYLINMSYFGVTPSAALGDALNTLLTPNMVAAGLSSSILNSALTPASAAAAGVIGAAAASTLSSYTSANLAAVNSPTTMGTVENSIATSGAPGQEKAWSWVWTNSVPAAAPAVAQAPDVTFTDHSTGSTAVGELFYMEWSSTGADSCRVEYDGPNGMGGLISTAMTSRGDQTPDGLLPISLTAIGEYHASVSCTNSAGTTVKTITHTVAGPSTLTASLLVNGVSEVWKNVGDAITYTWHSSANATSWDAKFTASGSGCKTPSVNTPLSAGLSADGSIGPISVAAEFAGCDVVVTYTAMTSGNTSPARSSVTIHVVAPSVAATQSFNIAVTPSTVSSGSAARIDITGAPTGTTCTVTNAAWPANTGNGTLTVNPTQTTTYTATCTTSAGVSLGTKSAILSVTQAGVTAAPDIVIKSGTIDTTGTNISRISLNTMFGGTVTVNWSVSNPTNTTCAAAGNWNGLTTIPTSGTWTTPNLYVNTTYGIACTNSLGTTYKYIDVAVSAQSNTGTAPVITIRSGSLTSDPNSQQFNLTTTSGGTVPISWEVNTPNTTCAAAGNWSGGASVATSGTWTTPNLYVNTTYGIACANVNGIAYKYVNISVQQPNSNLAGITITTPTAGATWTSGTAQTINWTANVTGNAGIFLTRASDGVGCLVSQVSLATGSVTLTPIIGQNCPNQNAMTLAAGNYYLGLTYPFVSAANAGGLYGGSQGQPIPVTLSTAATTGTLSFSQNSFNFSYVQGGNAPAAQSLTLTNTSNVAVTYSINVTNQPSWLTNGGIASPPSSLIPGGSSRIGAGVDATGYAPSTYTSTIVVSGNFTGSPIMIPVTLTITAATATPPTCADPSAYYYYYNPDVQAAGMNAYTHWTTYGYKEGRRSCWPPPVTAMPSLSNVKVWVANSNTASTQWVQNGSLPGDQDLYVKITGLDRTNTPKACASPSNSTACSDPAAFRVFTDAEWSAGNGTTEAVTYTPHGTVTTYPPGTYNGYGYYAPSGSYGAVGPLYVGSFTITAPPAAATPTINFFTASPTSVTSGQSSTLTLSSSNASSCTVTNTDWSSGKTNGTGVVSPTQTTTYVATCTNSTGQSAQSSVTVTVTTSSLASCSLPWGGSIASGSSATAYQTASVVSPGSCVSQIRTCNNGTLSGSYMNQSCSVTPPAATASCTLPDGTSLPVGQTTTSQLYWKNWYNGVGTCYSAPFYCNSSATLVPGLQFSPMPPQPITGQTLYSTQSSCVAATATTPAPTITTFSANVTTITSGQSSTLTLSSSNATSCGVTNVAWPTSNSGNTTAMVSPTQTTTYVATCTNSMGQSAPSSVTITVTQPAATSSGQWKAVETVFGIPYTLCSSTQTPGSSCSPVSSTNRCSYYAVNGGSNSTTYECQAAGTTPPPPSTTSCTLPDGTSLPVGQTTTSQLYWKNWYNGVGTCYSAPFYCNSSATLVPGLQFSPMPPQPVAGQTLYANQSACVAAVAVGGLNQTASVLNAFSTARSSPSPSLHYVWNRNLEFNSPYTNDVVALQKALALQGLFSGDITGGFYAQTYSAVQAFQKKYGIDSTGYVGSDTRAKLNTLYK